MKNRYYFSIVIVMLLVAIICPGLLIAQSNGQVSGAVYESSTGSVLPGANIVIEGTSRGDAADRNGFFLVSNLSPGTYTVRVAFLGYEDGVQEIQIESGVTTKINFNLLETVIEGQDVVVYGNLSRGNAKALQDQKNAPNIKNVVSSDQFQLFPDRNAAETAARIPGVSISYDQGEGEFVQIRGIGPEYNSLTANGQRIPAPDPDAGRSVGMDLLNQDLIENIIVTKASTPEIDGDAIGGNINFEMMQAPDNGMLMLHVGGGYNVQHSHYETYGKEIVDLAAIGGQRFLGGKLGVLVAGSYFKTNRGSTLREFEYDDVENSDDIFAQHSNDYDVKRERYGLNLNTEWKFDDLNKIYLNLNYNQYLDNEIRRLNEWIVEDDEETKETRNRLEDQTLTTVMFGGKHNFNDIKVDYLASWIKAAEDMPARTYFRFQRDFDFSGYSNDAIKDFNPASEFPEQGESLELNRIRVDDKLKEDADLAGMVNVEIPFEFMDRISTVKFGGKYLDKSVKFEEERLELKKFAEDHVLEEGEWGFEDVVVQPDDEDYLGASGVKYLDMTDDNYDAGETVLAAYGMTNLNVNNNLSFLVGARFENTTNNYKTLAIESVNQKAAEASYSSILPSLHATYRFDNNTNLRFAYSTGIARPNYKSLVPVEFRDDDDREISKGNPDLKPTTSNSIDVMYEKYTSNLGLLSGGLFYKKLSDIIVGTRVIETIDGMPYDVSMPINGDQVATVYGIEIAVNQRLNVLNVPFLNNFSIYGNYTYTKSETEIGDRTMPLANSPENIVNLALIYDNPKIGLSFVISNNFRDAILGSVGSDKYTDAYYDAEYHLDLSATKDIGDHLSVTLQLNNLTDQAEHEVFGDPSEDFSTIRQWAKFNSYGTLGITYRR
ncbi:TonB-dependent receptor [Candidatus Neomarinimicrobiota bacterium]